MLPPPRYPPKQYAGCADGSGTPIPYFDDTYQRGGAKPYISKPLAIQILKDGSANPQTQCLLLKIFPAEILLRILEMVMVVPDDPSWRPSTLRDTARITHRANFERFKEALPRRHFEVLRTCKLVYLMAYQVPFARDSFKIEVPNRSRLYLIPQLDELSVWQFAMIRSLDVWINQFALENLKVLNDLADVFRVMDRHEGKHLDTVLRRSNNPDNLTLEDYHPFQAERIVKLRLRIGWQGWWKWSETPEASEDRWLGLDPARGGFSYRGKRLSHHQAMRENARRREDGRPPAVRISEDGTVVEGWGSTLMSAFPDLQTLELRLEAMALKHDQLESVIECAKSWTFPVPSEEAELRWDGHVRSLRYTYGGPYSYNWKGKGESWMRKEGGNILPKAKQMEVRTIRYVRCAAGGAPKA